MIRSNSWEEGDRVLAPWESDWCYPGVIRCLDGDVAFIKFDDGDRALVFVEDLEPLAIRVGALVFCRSEHGPKVYYPAKVKEVIGEELEICYEDGREERTPVSCVRVERYPFQLGTSRN